MYGFLNGAIGLRFWGFAGGLLNAFYYSSIVVERLLHVWKVRGDFRSGLTSGYDIHSMTLTPHINWWHDIGSFLCLLWRCSVLWHGITVWQHYTEVVRTSDTRRQCRDKPYMLPKHRHPVKFRNRYYLALPNKRKIFRSNGCFI